MAEDDAEALVRVVARPIGVRGEPPKPADQHGRDDEDLRRALDERADERKKLVDARGSLAGRYQEPCPAGCRHVGIMPVPPRH